MGLDGLAHAARLQLPVRRFVQQRRLVNIKHHNPHDFLSSFLAKFKYFINSSNGNFKFLPE